jgi:ADP-heptose:LPS heptosyltransferase
VVLGGIPSERGTTEVLARALGSRAVDLTGRTSLGEYAALLRGAAVVVANDTGAAHLTAAVGGRVVTVFLSGDPVRWRHVAQLQTVVREDVGCNPCPHLSCPIDFRCATGVRPERVISAARAMAGTPTRPPAPSARP